MSIAHGPIFVLALSLRGGPQPRSNPSHHGIASSQTPNYRRRQAGQHDPQKRDDQDLQTGQKRQEHAAEVGQRPANEQPIERKAGQNGQRQEVDDRQGKGQRQLSSPARPALPRAQPECNDQPAYHQSHGRGDRAVEDQLVGAGGRAERVVRPLNTA